jgi:hypothetical protein
MKTVRSLQWAFVVFALAISGAWASGDDAYFSKPPVQARFDRLIPTSYPTIKPNFNRLRPTTRPLISPGVPRVHITEKLVRPTDQPLLHVN